MTGFGSEIKPLTFQGQLIDPETGELDMGFAEFLQDIWDWIAAGYVTIPCTVSGDANAIELQPKFAPSVGASGYAALLPFSFIATATSTGAVTIQVKGPGRSRLNTSDWYSAGLTDVSGNVLLDALPAYLGITAAGSGDIEQGGVYVAYYCPADNLPERFSIK